MRKVELNPPKTTKEQILFSLYIREQISKETLEHRLAKMQKDLTQICEASFNAQYFSRWDYQGSAAIVNLNGTIEQALGFICSGMIISEKPCERTTQKLNFNTAYRNFCREVLEKIVDMPEPLNISLKFEVCGTKDRFL